MSNTEQALGVSQEMKSLEERLQHDPEAWRAEPGEMLIGLVVGIERRTSNFGSYPAVTIRKDDGEELVFHAFRTVAKSELGRTRPVIGDRIGVLYIGPIKNADYHGYRVRLDRAVANADFNWLEFDPETSPANPVPEETAAA